MKFERMTARSSQSYVGMIQFDADLLLGVVLQLLCVLLFVASLPGVQGSAATSLRLLAVPKHTWFRTTGVGTTFGKPKGDHWPHGTEPLFDPKGKTRDPQL